MIYISYCNYLVKLKKRVVSKKEFSNALRDEQLETRKTSKQGDVDYYVEGVEMKSEEELKIWGNSRQEENKKLSISLYNEKEFSLISPISINSHLILHGERSNWNFLEIGEIGEKTKIIYKFIEDNPGLTISEIWERTTEKTGFSDIRTEKIIKKLAEEREVFESPLDKWRVLK